MLPIHMAQSTRIAQFFWAIASDNRTRAKDPGHGSRRKMRGPLVLFVSFGAAYSAAHFGAALLGAALLVACDGGHAVSGGPRGPGRNAGTERTHSEAASARPQPNPDAPT